MYGYSNMMLCTLKYDSSRVKCPHKIHTQKNTRTFWRWNTFRTLIVVMVSQGYACVSTHQKYTLRIWSFCLLIISQWSLKSSLPTHELQNNSGGGEEGQGWGGGSSSEGSQVLTLELRPEWLLLPPTSPVTSGSPLPCLQNFWGEVDHLSSLTPGSTVSPLTNMVHTCPLLAFHRPPPPTLGAWRRKQAQQKRRFQFSLFAPVIPFGKTHKKAP